MTHVRFIPSFTGPIAMLALAAFTSIGCAQGAASTDASATPLLKQFMTAGKDASITTFPTLLAGKPMKQVGDVVGLLLEKSGMTNMDTSGVEFRPPAEADLARTAEAFGEFIKGQTLTTDYALFTEFVASPQRKFTEVRSIIVTKTGDIVWTDQQTPNDADFKRIKPTEPMQCCILVVERLRPVLHLDATTGDDDSTGRLAKKWDQETGVPDKTEQAEMKKRLGIFKKTAAASTLVVYPVHAGDELNSDSATALVAMINKAGLAKATTAPHIEKLAVQPNMNEQKVLWGMARAFREQMRKAAPDADYVLYAHYLMGKGGVGAVHFAICDRRGEWVLVDFQNSHHPDFQSIKPATREECDRLVLKRLTALCK
jgi:hypothetical protein